MIRLPGVRRLSNRRERSDRNSRTAPERKGIGMGKITLILGGARSGKSRYAQERAERLSATGAVVAYVATATAEDEEMSLRIARHRSSRPDAWITVEEPRRVARALAAVAADVVIVDCLTLLITNILLEHQADRSDGMPLLQLQEEAVMREIEALLTECRRMQAEIFLISNEVGMAVVPPTSLGRAFRDIAGRVNQAVASGAEEVYLLVAGLAQRLK